MIFKRAATKVRAQGWVAISIELVIVTVGAVIALAAQQFASVIGHRTTLDQRAFSHPPLRRRLVCADAAYAPLCILP
jgi:hypothetical protein